MIALLRRIHEKVRFTFFCRKKMKKKYKEGDDYELKTDDKTFEEIRKYYLEDRPYDRSHKLV